LIVPTYQRQIFLAKTVELANQQDYPNLEVVIVDDSPEPIDITTKHFLSEKVAVRYLHVGGNGKRFSIGQKRNMAVMNARGKIIAHWDDDDYFRPHRISEQVAPILSGEADMTVLEHHYYFMSQQRQFYTVKRASSWGPHFGTFTFRRALWEAGLEYSDTSLAEDYGFAEAALDHGYMLKILNNEDGKHVYIRHSNTWQFAFAPDQATPVDRPEFFSKRDARFYAMASRLSSSTDGDAPNQFTAPSIKWNRPELRSIDAGAPHYNYGPHAYNIDKGGYFISWPVTAGVVVAILLGVILVIFAERKYGRSTGPRGLDDIHVQGDGVGSSYSSSKGYGSV